MWVARFADCDFTTRSNDVEGVCRRINPDDCSLVAVCCVALNGHFAVWGMTDPESAHVFKKSG